MFYSDVNRPDFGRKKNHENTFANFVNAFCLLILSPKTKVGIKWIRFFGKQWRNVPGCRE
jgi:hypothetical protein